MIQHDLQQLYIFGLLHAFSLLLAYSLPTHKNEELQVLGKLPYILTFTKNILEPMLE
jgi:hypothetical protein